jgi:hypothetical protein
MKFVWGRNDFQREKNASVGRLHVYIYEIGLMERGNQFNTLLKL